MMINFSDLYFVLFDFDDTLCIHANHETFSPDNWHDFDRKLLRNDSTWENSFPNRHMSEFMKLCQDNNIRLGLISHVLSVPQAIAKQKWVSDAYGVEIENYCVGTREQKIEMLKHIAFANDVDNHDILIVDDAYLTLTEAADAGFQAATPMEIVNYIENNSRKGCGTNESC